MAAGVWGFLVVWIATDQFSLRPGDPTAAQWAPLFLVMSGLLFSAQVYFQVLAHQLQYLSLLWSVVLFVQAATIETALLVGVGIDRRGVEPWVYPVIATTVVLLLVLVLAQVHSLRWARDRIHRELERVISDKSVGRLDSTQCRLLTAAAKRIVPLDFRPQGPFLGSSFSGAARYPDAWEDLEGLLSLHNIELHDNDRSFLKGMTDPLPSQLRGADAFYWYSGIAAGLVGSLAVLFGAAAL
ncbi:MAG: hypothetical protein WBF66_07240 [Dehalococcoidia bacterium]